LGTLGVTPDSSHYIEVAEGDIFMEQKTENEIWAGFGPVGNTEKKIGGF
jgi:hypothetical protein